MSPTKPPADDAADESLKRLGGGRWQTRDERFTIEPQSGTWAVVDAEETDDLGLPLVRGPFRSLTDAKAAIAGARSSEAPASPLAGRIERGGTEAPPAPASSKRASGSAATKTSTGDGGPGAKPAAAPPKSELAKPAGPGKRAADEPPAEPGWFRDLDGA